jgi:integrase
LAWRLSFTGRADFKTFNQEQAKAFKKWLEKKTNKDGALLSLSSMRAMLRNVRDFFEWLTIHPQYIRKIDGRAIQYLHLSDNANRAARASREVTPPTLAQLEKALHAMPHDTDIQKRDKAIIAFLVITCVRDDALVTLKMKDIDPAQKTVWQDPRHVRTKRRKGIVTRFVGAAMPSAETIFLEWFIYAKEKLKIAPDDPLFPSTLVLSNPKTLCFEVAGLSRVHWADAAPVREICKAAFAAVGLPYFNPHSFRNTIIQWAQKHCTQLEFKAISQNVGHDHAMTTYNSYGTLSEAYQIEVVGKIGQVDTDLSQIPKDVLIAEMNRRMGK